ncbi:MAG: hypothetical protein HOI91_10790 [Halieaceae bacterium]|jgi:S-formylglutathione hydrolase|nr:hypothetical protein [Halieaceae bacterium]|tara:strand:+ start:464 stop:1468 length:1005 start_codon:yes stop_codon:yes gene_type:complete
MNFQEPLLTSIPSEALGEEVEISVLFPPDFDGETLPLIINLHGGGDDRDSLAYVKPMYDDLMTSGQLPRAVIASFSAGLSYYAGGYEAFIVDEFPSFLHREFGVSLEPKDTAITGVSMGGYGALKIAFKHPERFGSVAAIAPAVLPYLDYPTELSADNWATRDTIDPAVWGDPVDAKRWRADNPANVVIDSAERIRSSGLAVYLECGDEDLLNLHWGTEFLHRTLWDQQIAHEYRLVRWGDHLGPSFPERMQDTNNFLAKGLTGGRHAPRDIPLTEAEAAFAADFANGILPAEDALLAFDPLGERAPAVLRAMFGESLTRAEKILAASPKFKRF